ncbi:MAG: hypothetical protein ACRD10_06755 [Terriglobia bacterium]
MNLRTVTLRPLWRAGLILALAYAIAAPGRLQAQNLVDDALSWFPPQITAFEFSDLSALRSLPDYQTLRTRYLGRNLRTLETSLSRLGIQENDVDAMALGWRSLANGKPQYEGLAVGRFDATTLSHRAAASGLVPLMIDGQRTYCLVSDPNSTCVTVIDNSLGAFGPLPILEGMLKARRDAGTDVSSNAEFVRLARSAQSSDPIWGVALGVAVSQWFKAWMPAEKNLQMDWASAFSGVNSLVYHVQASDNVQLNVILNCASNQAASSVRQLLEGLKLVQQLAWHAANAGQPDPFKDVEVQASGQKVSFRLTADYAALERTGQLGQP